MPLVEITLRKGKSPEYIRAVSDSVHDALVAQANVPADDRFQIVHQVEPAALIAHRTYAGVNRSDDLILVKIILNTGRTEIKKNLYADIAVRLGKAIGVRPDDILICLLEVTKENWSFGRGLATYG